MGTPPAPTVGTLLALSAMHNTASITVHYIRHGQSIWNEAQSAARAAGQPEDSVVALGMTDHFTDAPLTKAGVAQAVALQERLFLSPPVNARGVASSLSCTSCPPPRIFVSNLRRAIDTGLLALKPLLDRDDSLAVQALPALQETCHYADCVPLPRYENGTILKPLPRSAPTPQLGPLQMLRVRQVLELQASAIIAAASAANSGYLLNDAYSRLRLAPHVQYDDRRRLAPGTQLSSLPPAEVENALGDLAARAGDILSAILGDPALIDQTGPPASPVIIAAHSRLLRELLLLFYLSSLSAPVRLPDACTDGECAAANALLRWDGATNSGACAALAGEDARLSNCGVVTFDLLLCSGPPDCAAPTLTLSQCSLDVGSRVDARVAPSRLEGRAPSPTSESTTPSTGDGGATEAAIAWLAAAAPVAAVAGALLVMGWLLLRYAGRGSSAAGKGRRRGQERTASGKAS